MQIHYGAERLNIKNPVVTIGSFDGVHKGHKQVIESLKRVARHLGGESVIISFEPHPREVLYPQEKRLGILTTLEEKIGILEACGVDHLFILNFTRELADLDYADFVKNILIDQVGLKGLVVGYDHRFGKNREGSFEKLRELAEKHHFYLEQEEVYEENQINISSTKIRTALELGDISLVNEYLGYSYMLSGTVVNGDKIGRMMGFPTANIQVSDDRKLLPAVGVYAVKVNVEGKEYRGMLNIGIRPTVSTAGVIRIEVHIFDFNQNIYGQEIQIALLARIRGERKFNDTEELKKQLLLDQEKCIIYKN
ncbi:MAG: bifunctional riboflavin kinase/FAD synthetase [Odoribacter sp.]